jgi:triacylglycerol lipase
MGHRVWRWCIRILIAHWCAGVLLVLPLNAVAKDTVVLLHGLARSAGSMSVLEERLQGAGFNVIAETYPSTDGTIEDHARWLEAFLKTCSIENDTPIHFVTHSLGGIVVRQLLLHQKPPNLGRVVMLAPPNQGSEVVDYLHDWVLFQYVFGPSGGELGTHVKSTPNQLGAVNYEVGVIAGNKTLDPLGSLLIPGADDGRVSVERTKVTGMKDFILVEESHTFIMDSKEVACQVVAFLKTGRFDKALTQKQAKADTFDCNL